MQALEHVVHTSTQSAVAKTLNFQMFRVMIGITQRCRMSGFDNCLANFGYYLY